MTLARRIGIDVPDFRLVPIEAIEGLPDGMRALGATAFAIRRFDRRGDDALVHIEDFAQVFGVYPVTVTVTFAATWTATTGAGGPLGALTRTTTVPVRVVEVQAVIG